MMAVRWSWCVLALGLVACSGSEGGTAAEVPTGTVKEDAGGDIHGDPTLTEAGALDTGASSPDGDSTNAPDGGDAGSSTDAASGDAAVAGTTLVDGNGKAVPYSKVSVAQRGGFFAVTYVVTVPAMAITSLSFVYGPGSNSLHDYVGVTLRDFFCADGGAPTQSGTGTPLTFGAGLTTVSGRVVDASAPGLSGKYTATFANLPYTAATCQ